MEPTYEAFLECCGSNTFASRMTKSSPFSSIDHAIDTARRIWWEEVSVLGWLEAFAAHPRIGDVKALEKKFSTGKQLAAGEQSAALNTAANNELQELAEWNQKYEERFGHVFLICASGKSCLEVLIALKSSLSKGSNAKLFSPVFRSIMLHTCPALLAGSFRSVFTSVLHFFDFIAMQDDVFLKTAVGRFSNQPVVEFRVAAAEQQKITELRLRDLKAWEDKSSFKKPPVAVRPPITTHVLDVSLGAPGVGIDVLLEKCGASTVTGEDEYSFTGDGSWSTIGSSITNADGRSGPLMANSNFLEAGRYRLTFKTGEYFLKTSKAKDGISGFYPYICLVFEVKPSQVAEHFHVPLLIAPYSYTTYRGS